MSVVISEERFLEILKDVGAQHFPLEDALTERVETVPPMLVTGSSHAPVQAPVTRQNIWGCNDAHPVVLYALLGAAYGNDWLEWEAETFRPRITEDFPGAPLNDLNLSKIEATRVLILSDAFWERWEIFLACCMPFNNEFPDFVVMQVPMVAQVLVACSTAVHTRTTSTPAWSTEMQEYIKAIYQHDGIWRVIPPAAFVMLNPPEGTDLEHGIQAERRQAAQLYLNENRERLTHQLGLFHA